MRSKASGRFVASGLRRAASGWRAEDNSWNPNISAQPPFIQQPFAQTPQLRLSRSPLAANRSPFLSHA
jgi:hypothetical protein